jgi:hypothetical protein
MGMLVTVKWHSPDVVDVLLCVIRWRFAIALVRLIGVEGVVQAVEDP